MFLSGEHSIQESLTESVKLTVLSEDIQPWSSWISLTHTDIRLLSVDVVTVS